jgi:hypothetical protein
MGVMNVSDRNLVFVEGTILGLCTPVSWAAPVLKLQELDSSVNSCKRWCPATGRMSTLDEADDRII